MSKLKKQSSNPKVSNAPKIPESAKIVISMQCFTHNSSYNFDSFKRQEIQQKATTMYNFIEKTIFICQNSWIDMHKNSRTSGMGFEKIPFHRVHFAPHNFSLTPDRDIFVIRFNHRENNDGRILGFKEGNVYFIIGVDLNYNAYPHS